jgi:hypothetical protein
MMLSFFGCDKSWVLLPTTAKPGRTWRYCGKEIKKATSVIVFPVPNLRYLDCKERVIYEGQSKSSRMAVVHCYGRKSATID